MLAELHTYMHTLQIVNDYDNNVYNGDLGFVRRVDVPNKSLTVEFPPQVQGAGKRHPYI